MARALALGAALVGLVWLGLAAGGFLRPAPRADRPLRVTQPVRPLGFDPHLHADFATFSLLANVYEGLTTLDAELHLQPALAESWDNPDDLTWRFRLRPGVRFHDGRPLTAADVVFSLERARRHPLSDVGGYVATVESARARDALTIEVATVRPYAVLPHKLVFVPVVPAGEPDLIERPVGTGPYRVRWAPGADRVELAASPTYWGGAAAVQSAVVEFAAGAEARARLLGGRTDIAGLEPADVEALAAHDGLRVEVKPSLGVRYLRLRTDRPPFSDARVREAVDLALDRAALVRVDRLGHGAPAGQLVSPGVFGFDPSIAVTRPDAARARELLRAAGHAGGLGVDLEFRAGLGPAELVRQLAAVGIRVEPRPRPWDEMYARLRAGAVGFYYGGAMADSGDAGDVFDSMLHSRDPVQRYGEGNYMNYAHPELDRLIERANGTADAAERRKLLQSCARLMREERALLPLYVLHEVYGLREGVLWRPRVDDRVLLWEVQGYPR